MIKSILIGSLALELTLSRIRKTIALLEPMVEKLKTKPKVKSVHKGRTEEKNMDHVYWIDSRLVKSGKRWNNNFKVPVPSELPQLRVIPVQGIHGDDPVGVAQ